MQQSFTRLYDFDDNVQLALTYELSPDLNVIQRQVYGMLDLLGDLGGLAGSLYTLFFSLIIILQYKAAVSYVSNHTYLVREEEIDSSKTLKSTSISTQTQERPSSVATRDGQARISSKRDEYTWIRLPIGFFASIKLSLQRILDPVICDCCKRRFSNRDKLSHLSDLKVTKEMKIVRWIRLMRAADIALQRLFTP